MVLSEMIKLLQKTLEEKGDQELFIWVDTPDDTMFLSKTPVIEISELDGDDFEVPEDLTTNGKILAITNFNYSTFDEDSEKIK